jgi:hypothetical protein
MHPARRIIWHEWSDQNPRQIQRSIQKDRKEISREKEKFRLRKVKIYNLVKNQTFLFYFYQIKNN